MLALQTGFAVAQIPLNSKANLAVVEGQKKSTNTSVSATTKPKECPTGFLFTPLKPPQPSGHHTVTLKWKANEPTIDPVKNVVGYCLYRRKAQGLLPNEILKCKGCQLVSPMPIAGTGCVDDRVEDDSTYYYVVTAVNVRGAMSLSSNEAAAKIGAEESTKPAVASSYPFCRAKENEKSQP
ncbi:MAG: hypothetical protein WA609_07500 [Terriglobales bacterium]